jgi:hypothetical protein
MQLLIGALFPNVAVIELESMSMARQELKVIDIFLSNIKMECLLTLFLIMIIAFVVVLLCFSRKTWYIQS